MSNSFPIMPIYLNKTIDDKCTSKLKFYSVQYDTEKMNEFLEELKEKYSQTFREYGNVEDIANLQYYKVMDSTFDEEKYRYRLITKSIKKGRFGEPDELLYRYTKYPVIYKIIKILLDGELFNLHMLCDYIEQLECTKKTQTMSFDYAKKLTGISITEMYDDNYYVNNRNKMNLFTEAEKHLTIEEYNEIINNIV